MDVEAAAMPAAVTPMDANVPKPAGGMGSVDAMTAEDMIAKGIVPVKKEFLRKPGPKGAAADAMDQGGEQPRPSKNQKRKELKESRGAELCNNHVLGRCAYGARCKFSHDTAAFVAAKPPDLPGRCIFANAEGGCPYGITCRYALTHTADDELHQLLRGSATAAAAAAAATTPAGAAVAAQDGGAGDASASNGVGPTHGSVGSGPVQVLELPVPAKVEKESNNLSKDVQSALWKNRYDFSRADDLLRSMNLRITVKPSKPGPHGQGQGQAVQQPAAAAAAKTAAAEAAAAAAPAPAAEAGVEVAEGGVSASGNGAEVGDDDMGPAAKRPRTEAGADATAVAALAASSQQAEGPQQGAAAAAEARAEARAMHVELPARPEERRRVDFRGKTYLAPLTTVGNLPFRRVAKDLGCHITCGEMALATNLLQGQASEWALLRRHPCEDVFGVQVCGGYPDALTRCGQLLDDHIDADFVDINMGCPIDLVCDKNAGSSLLKQPKRIEQIVRAVSAAMPRLPLTFKTRKGYNDGEDVAHKFLPRATEWGATAVTLHGRTRQQRYTKLADWQYIEDCGKLAADEGVQLIGNGDIFSFEQWNEHLREGSPLASCMIGRGALIKPWIFTEINEQRHWDISAGERLDLLKSFCSYGLEHWGSDQRGVETTRRFLLEWLSFTHRYVPVGLLEVVPQQMQHRPPAFVGRSDLETLLGSEAARDWVRVSEMLLGPAPASFSFAPKHKSNSYSAAATSELDMARG